MIPVFVQIGATRDGLDPYRKAASRRGLFTVLIESPDYIQYRQALGYPEFDYTISLSCPTNSTDVLRELERFTGRIKIILAGFERYTSTAYEVAQCLNILPGSKENHFTPVTKYGQRELLEYSNVQQPNYWILDVDSQMPELNKLSYPVVVKPTDGGGGLGVFFAESANDVEFSINEIKRLRNYDGGYFHQIIIEEFISGPEYSIQGMVYDGRVQVLTLCSKLIRLERYSENNSSINGFREIGHIAESGATVSMTISNFARNVMESLRYRDGPFHIDFIVSNGVPVFIEAGFRLSGGHLVSLVETTTGISWADLVIGWFLKDTGIASPDSKGVFGQINIMTEKEILRAQELQEQETSLIIERLPGRPGEAEAQLQQATSLLADRLRHKAPIARIKGMSVSVEKMLSLFTSCVPDALMHTTF